MIRFEEITVQYGDKKVLEDFNLVINEHEKILLSAPSGSGKSSIVKGFLGYVPFHKGRVYYNEAIINEKNIRLIRSKVAYVSQDVELQNIPVRELIAQIFDYKYNKGLTYSKDKLKELLTYFHLEEEIIDKKVSALSGGERQRMGLIIAALLERDIWILDEITSGLDETLKEKVVDYVASRDQIVIVISHDQIWQNNNQFKIVRW
jgi:putative ABC transport system ATP-binding protein